MHELGIINRVQQTALRLMREQHAHAVTEVRMKVGVLSGILPDYLTSYFEMINKNTPAEGARLMIEIEPAVFICRDCGAESVFPKYGPDFICCHCSSENLSLTGGSSLKIISVTVV